MKSFVRVLTMVSALGMMTFGVVYRGKVSDAKCGHHFNAACARKCVKAGAAAVLLSGKHLYHVANPKALAPYAGDSVKVVGVWRHHKLFVKKVTKL